VRLLRGIALSALVISLTPHDAGAACSCQCVNGRMQALCDNAMELRPLCPLAVCPLVPPSIQPLAPLMLPPLGTTHCAPQQVQNPYTRQYEWRTICR